VTCFTDGTIAADAEEADGGVTVLRHVLALAADPLAASAAKLRGVLSKTRFTELGLVPAPRRPVRRVLMAPRGGQAGRAAARPLERARERRGRRRGRQPALLGQGRSRPRAAPRCAGALTRAGREARGSRRRRRMGR
jgi:hypothetical protein